MVEGYMVYQCMVYISEYLPKLVENMNVPRIRHLKSINKFEGEILLGKGTVSARNCSQTTKEQANTIS